MIRGLASGIIRLLFCNPVTSRREFDFSLVIDLPRDDGAPTLSDELISTRMLVRGEALPQVLRIWALVPTKRSGRYGCAC